MDEKLLDNRAKEMFEAYWYALCGTEPKPWSELTDANRKAWRAATEISGGYFAKPTEVTREDS